MEVWAEGERLKLERNGKHWWEGRLSFKTGGEKLIQIIEISSKE